MWRTFTSCLLLGGFWWIKEPNVRERRNWEAQPDINTHNSDTRLPKEIRTPLTHTPLPPTYPRQPRKLTSRHAPLSSIYHPNRPPHTQQRPYLCHLPAVAHMLGQAGDGRDSVEQRRGTARLEDHVVIKHKQAALAARCKNKVRAIRRCKMEHKLTVRCTRAT